VAGADGGSAGGAAQGLRPEDEALLSLLQWKNVRMPLDGGFSA